MLLDSLTCTVANTVAWSVIVAPSFCSLLKCIANVAINTALKSPVCYETQIFVSDMISLISIGWSPLANGLEGKMDFGSYGKRSDTPSCSLCLMPSCIWNPTSAQLYYWWNNKEKLFSVRVCMRCVHACAHFPSWPLTFAPSPRWVDSAKALWRLVPSAWQPVTVLWWWFFFSFLQEMVSDWEQCVNSSVTLDKPARRPVTGTYGMFDRERGCELHWMIKWCFSPVGNVMLSGKYADHRSLKRLTPASLWHLLQGPGPLWLVPDQF